MERFRMSLARTCLSSSGISTIYYDAIPEGFTMPAIYLPPADVTSSKDGLNAYKDTFIVYAKVFAVTTGEAAEIAERILNGIMGLRCRLPVYCRDGKKTGEILCLAPPEMRAIDIGTMQITMTYSIVCGYKSKTEYPKVNSTGINKSYD